ncbi:MAG TPA: tetratricopeptide repeat protein [Myxococcaceae bacterium]|nr:tetratricopeptide repeat protein [Myxococcaceae bacterium]
MISSLVVLTASLVQLGVTPTTPENQGAPSSAAPASASGSAAVQPALARQKVGEGDQKWKAKDYRSASFLYQDAVNADPNNVEALFKLGTAYAVLGYHAQAIERWKRVTELSNNAAVKKSAEENIAKAKAKMAKAAASNPQAAGKPPGSGPVAPTARAQAREAYEEGVKQVNARKYDAGLEKLTEAIKLEPNLAVAYVARGSAFLGLRRYSEAATDYQYALKIAPTLSAPLYGLAESFRGLGRLADARQHYEQYAQSTAADVRPELQARAREQAAALR